MPEDSDKRRMGLRVAQKRAAEQSSTLSQRLPPPKTGTRTPSMGSLQLVPMPNCGHATTASYAYSGGPLAVLSVEFNNLHASIRWHEIIQVSRMTFIVCNV